MKFLILLITYVFVQISSCTQSDVPAEELVQTKPMVSTPTYSALNSESETEEVPATTHSPEGHDSNQDRYDSTSSNLRTSAFPKITWNSVSSLVLSTDVLRKGLDHENTSPSNSLQNTTQPSEINAFNYQTPPSIFENLDHEENELDSDTRVTDMPKSLKTTLNTGLPPLYAHKFETVGPESLNDSPHTSHSNVDQLLSENEPISGETIKSDTSFEHNGKNLTGMPLVSDHTIVEASTSASAIDFSNPELSAESIVTSSMLTKVGTTMSDSNLFGSENLYRNNMSETERMENTTSVTDSIKSSLDENLKSTTSDTELDTENKAQESIVYNSSLDPNSTNTESPKDLEPVNTLLFFEKSNEGVDLETAPASSFTDQSRRSSGMTTSATTVVSEAMNTDNLTTEKFAATTDTLPLDISSNTRISPFTISTIYDESLPQKSSDYNSSHENHVSTVTEVTTAHQASDKEVLSISTLTSSKASVIVDNPVTTIPETHVSIIFKLNTATVLTETDESNESTSASISEDSEMKNTTLSTVHTTEHPTSPDDGISQTATGLLERDRPIKYHTSTISDIEKETSAFFPSVKPILSEITSSIYSSVNTFEDTSKLLTTTDPNIKTEHYVPPIKILLSTTTLYNVVEPNTVTYLPSQKHVDTESSSDSSIEQSTAPLTIPYHWLPSSITQSPTTVSSDVESKSNSVAFIPSHKDTHTEISKDVSIERSTVPQTGSYPLSSTTFEPSPSSATQNVFSTFKPVHDFSSEKTSTSKLESNTVTDEIVTSLPDSYSSSIAVTTTDTSILPPETHREGKHIPFSTASTIRVTDLSSEYGFLLVTTQKIPTMKVPVNNTEVQFTQIQIEDINPVDRTNIITAIIQFPADSTYKTDMKGKLVRAHQWLDKVLTKEFQNWTGDPFQKDDEQENELPFGDVSIFYVKPTPETNASHITLTFIVYNAWRNRTLPVDFVPGTLNFYSKELKESINASAVYFYHGLATENYDLLSAVFDKYGIIIFTISLAVVGITILVCVVVFYRKRTRQSIHYLADSKLQQNLQEAVGIDLTPASIILQDEKEEKGSKICDDEGWLVPIADVPVAEDNNVPNVQDTKL